MVVLLVLLVLFGVAGAEARSLRGMPPQKGAATDAVLSTSPDGPGLFRERGCAQCHAIRGVGGYKGPDLSGVGRRLKKEAIERQIVHGGGAMPAFGEALPPEEIATLVRYLEHCRDRDPHK